MNLIQIGTLVVLLFFPLLVSASASSNVASHAVHITEPPAYPTLLPRQADRYGFTSCLSMMASISRCSSAISNYDSLPFASLTKCFCSASFSWAPSAYDNAFANCMSYMKTVSPSYYSASLVPNGWQTAPCSQVSAMAAIAILSVPGLVDFEVGLNTTSANIKTAKSTIDSNRQACSSWSGIISSCSVDHRSAFKIVSGGFQHPVKEASCLCYTTASASFLSYAPNGYDHYWRSCLKWYKTAKPEFYSKTILSELSESEIVTPCARIGDVIASEASAMATTTDPGTGIGFAPTMPTATNPVLTIVTKAVATNIANPVVVGRALGLGAVLLAIGL